MNGTREELENKRVEIRAAIDKIAAAHPGVTSGRIEWYGSGDEGGVQDSDYEGADVDGELAEDLERLVDEFLWMLYGSWYDNEGGVGAGIIDFEKRTIVIEHNWYTEESEPDDKIIVGETISRRKNLLSATVMPDEINIAEIAEEAIQAAFKVIADSLEEAGYPVTGDITPCEAMTLENSFQGYVRALALNNDVIASLNDEEEVLA